jgi:hypothetical protein
VSSLSLLLLSEMLVALNFSTANEIFVAYVQE